MRQIWQNLAHYSRLSLQTVRRRTEHSARPKSDVNWQEIQRSFHSENTFHFDWKITSFKTEIMVKVIYYKLGTTNLIPVGGPKGVQIVQIGAVCKHTRNKTQRKLNIYLVPTCRIRCEYFYKILEHLLLASNLVTRKLKVFPLTLSI